MKSAAAVHSDMMDEFNVAFDISQGADCEK